MGEIDSVTVVHLVQLENRQLKIEKLKESKNIFLFVSIAERYGKIIKSWFSQNIWPNLDFVRFQQVDLKITTTWLKLLFLY